MRLVLGPGCQVDLDRRRVERDGHILGLTEGEVSLLRVLARHIGQDVSLDELRGPGPKVAQRLREKLEPDPAEPRHLVTVHGVGYRLLAEAVLPEEVPPAAPSATALVGRSAELADLRGLLALHDVATVVGPGGVGKTRVARELCSEQAGLWIDLTAARDAAGLYRAVARALRLPLSGEPRAQIGRALHALGPALIVLDDAGPDVRDALCHWVPAAPALRWVVTSRRPLGLPDEGALELPPLSLNDAVQLYLRASRSPSGAPRPVLARLVEALGRLPLAIELVAARPTPFAPSDPREHPLSEALAWTWSLLAEPEQTALARCSLFRTPFRLAAAEAVLDVERPGDVVQALLDARLLFRAPATDTPRLAMLEPIQAFARAHLSDPEAPLRHARFFAGWGSPELLRDAEQADPVRVSELRQAEHDELVAGIEAALRAGEAGTSLALARALTQVTMATGPPLGAGSWVERALALASDAPELARARFDARIAWIEALGRAGRPRDACALLPPARTDAPDAARRSEADLVEATLLADLGRRDAARRLAEGEGPDALRLFVLASLDRDEGCLAEARARLERVLELVGPDLELKTRAHQALADVHQLAGRHPEALHHQLEALRLARELGATALEAEAWQALGGLHGARGDLDRAAEAFEAAAGCLARLGLSGFVEAK